MQWTCSAIAKLRYRAVLSVRQDEALLLAAESDDGHARSAIAARTTSRSRVAAAATAEASTFAEAAVDKSADKLPFSSLDKSNIPDILAKV